MLVKSGYASQLRNLPKLSLEVLRLSSTSTGRYDLPSPRDSVLESDDAPHPRFDR